jgi:hypothetical protein
MLPRFADVDAALEEGAIANADALCGHIPGQRTFTADVHTVAGIDITAYFKTTTSRAVIFADTWASRLTVTRLSGELIAPSTLPSIYNDSEPMTSPLICRLLPIVAGSAAVGDGGEVLEGVGSWITAMDTDDRVSSSVEDSEGVPGWVCSLLMVNTLFSILHRHNSVGPIPCLLLANNATSARLGAQLLPGDASDSPETENKIRNHYKEEQPDSHWGGTDACATKRCDTRDTEQGNHEAGESTITGCCAPPGARIKQFPERSGIACGLRDRESSFGCC